MTTNRLRVGVDLDGVIYNWGDTVRFLILEHHGIDLAPSTHWTYVQENVPAEVWEWLWKSGDHLGMFKYGSLIKGAVEGLRALSKDYDLEIITHRPAWAISDTCAFISRLPNVWSGVHLLTKEEPKSSIDVDIFLDDRPTVIQDTTLAGKQAVVFDQPWNLGIDSPHPFWRAYGWSNVPSVIGDASDWILERQKERNLTNA